MVSFVSDGAVPPRVLTVPYGPYVSLMYLNEPYRNPFGRGFREAHTVLMAAGINIMM